MKYRRSLTAALGVLIAIAAFAVVAWVITGVGGRGSVTAVEPRVIDPWTRNIFNIPRGTGSGFVWDNTAAS
ncbi:MAG TPA: hypothetical protein VHI98_12245 [Vicinamibacterales bacterium]|jgi:hypothetical protein|nr:hypothetical protein [Vicinamibacterales bacterium]